MGQLPDMTGALIFLGCVAAVAAVAAVAGWALIEGLLWVVGHLGWVG